MNKNETIVFEVLKENGCYGRDKMITPNQLVEKCKAKGLSDVKTIERATVGLIDSDIVEYEMDNNLQTSELWLIEN